MIKGLYFITPSGPDATVVKTVRAALRGGARVVQYRDKERPYHLQVELGRQLGQLCRDTGAAFLANDSPELARDCAADGVHLGQGDGSIAAARTILGTGKLIGVSTRNVEQVV